MRQWRATEQMSLRDAIKFLHIGQNRLLGLFIQWSRHYINGQCFSLSITSEKHFGYFTITFLNMKNYQPAVLLYKIFTKLSRLII